MSEASTTGFKSLNENYTVSQKKTWCRTFCDNFINC